MGTGGSGRNVGNTSGSRDGGYNGGADHHHSISENIGDLKDKYRYEGGYFGTEGSGVSKRRIESEDPLATAHDFYDTATYSGVESPLPTGEGVKSQMKDGTVISIRKMSKSPDGSPAVDISVKKSADSSDLKAQKIHFVQKEDKEQ